ncbi:unnamed protein product [Parajaminaea phylloscopi]
MPRKTRASQSKEAASETAKQPRAPEQAVTQSSPSPASPMSDKGKERRIETEDGVTEDVAGSSSSKPGRVQDESASDAGSHANADKPKKTTNEERRQKMASLRQKMTSSISANRKDLILDKRSGQPSFVKDASNSRKLAKAEETLDRRDAEEKGQDWERIRNWKYTIEDEERWEDKLASKDESRDKGLIDANGLAARSYQRGLKTFKPDLKSYESSTAASAQSSPSRASSSALVQRGTTEQALARPIAAPAAGIDDLTYGTHRADDNAVDRVVSHLNMEADVRSKRSRKRPNAGANGEEDVTYINDKNAHFNRKLGRYYDAYTKEIRDNFERGTAL